MTTNSNSRQQRTVARAAKVEGFGFWSGLDNTVEFRPAAANAGITFVRADLAGQPRINASIKNQSDALRRTTLVAGLASVEMVEHLMAALAGLQIDNCEVWIARAEMPGFDGSSVAFADALAQAGTVIQQADRMSIVIDETFRISGDENNKDAWVEAIPASDPQRDGLTIAYELDYPQHAAIGQQRIEMEVTPASFRKELAGARTFLLQHEADWLRDQGIGRRVTYRDVLVFGEQGLIDNKLHFSDECVRHKALDVLGDLALIGCDIVGTIVAHRSGHILNAAMVRELKKRYTTEQQSRRSAA